MNDVTDTDIAQAAAACANEPIQFSGGIQPYGYLLSCHPTTGEIRHASANCAELFECEVDELIGQLVTHLIQLPAPFVELTMTRRGDTARYIGSANVGTRARFCDVSLHIAQDLAHLEIEPQPQQSDLAAAELVHGLIECLGEQHTPDAELHHEMARQVRLLTGFDRVMVYRFGDDDTGEVIAESLAEGVQSYLGVRYPGSDIPAQARALYLRNRVRVIANTDYQPSPIVPPLAADGGPLDLSMHGLRSVSPVHLEYMRNMGMAASMSISIIVDGQLWGLVACHHRAPRQLPPRHRTAADLLGMFYSLRVTSMQHMAAAMRKSRARVIRTQLLHVFSATADAAGELPALLPQLQEIIPADAALLLDGEASTSSGDTLTPATLAAARAWWQGQSAPVASTHLARDWWGDAAPESHAGILGMRLAGGRAVLLLRREAGGEVRWAGEPVKHLVATDDGLRLAPRRSFNIWRETVRGQALPWSREDLADADSTGLLLRQSVPAPH